MMLSVVAGHYVTFFFFFLNVHAKEGKMRIRTCNLNFIRHNSQLIELSLRDR
jgi:hypothetical protein